MSDSRLRLVAASGLALGAVLGVAGTFTPSASLRGLAWGVDGTALIVSASLLTVHHVRRGNELAAVGVPILTGRSFHPGDAGGAHVIVDRTFVDRMFGGENPLGRRVRYVGSSREAGEGNIVLGRWHEIVGVVNDFPLHLAGGEPPTPRMYHAVSPGDVYPVALAVRVRGTAPSAFSDELREIGASVDPALQLRNVSTIEDAMRREQGLMRLIAVTLIAVVGSVLALSAAGIYALMSFTVARRRKEIGIRAREPCWASVALLLSRVSWKVRCFRGTVPSFCRPSQW